MQNQNRSSGRRSGRSGTRRSRSGGHYGPSTPAPKLTFWQKLTAFFRGSQPVSSRSSGRRSERPEPSGSSRPGRGDNPRLIPKPERIEVSSPKIYVGNLSFDATETDLGELFNGVGKVQSAEIVTHRYNQKSKGFAFVTMTSIDEAKRAVVELHDQDFMGRKLVVSGAKSGELRSNSYGD